MKGLFTQRKKSIRIALFSKQLPSDAPNGVACQVHRLANALVSRGQEVTCYSFSPLPQDALYRHVKLDYVSKSALINKFTPAVMFRMIDTRPYDILHYHGDDFLCAGGARRVRTFYGSALWEARFAARPGRFFYQAVFYAFEWISCLRRGALIGISKVTMHALPLVREVVPCCVPLDRYVPGTGKTEAPSILFIGDLDSRKRGRLLIETFERRIRPSFPGATLTVVGPQTAGAREGVRFAGQLGEEALILEFQRSWIYCSVSSYEGFGVPLIEAMACGTAVAATDNSGAREIVTDGSDGLLCNDENLAESLTRLISEKSTRESLIANGLRTAQKFDGTVIADRYLNRYRTCLGKNHEG
jgi:phosphatidyl-myo-inositol alpha-mannosyltransferase